MGLTEPVADCCVFELQTRGARPVDTFTGGSHLCIVVELPGLFLWEWCLPSRHMHGWQLTACQGHCAEQPLGNCRCCATHGRLTLGLRWSQSGSGYRALAAAKEIRLGIFVSVWGDALGHFLTDPVEESTVCRCERCESVPGHVARRCGNRAFCQQQFAQHGTGVRGVACALLWGAAQQCAHNPPWAPVSFEATGWSQSLTFQWAASLVLPRVVLAVLHHAIELGSVWGSASCMPCQRHCSTCFLREARGGSQCTAGLRGSCSPGSVLVTDTSQRRARLRGAKDGCCILQLLLEGHLPSGDWSLLQCQLSLCDVVLLCVLALFC